MYYIMKTRSGKKVVVKIPTENAIKKMKKQEKLIKKTKETLKKAKKILGSNSNKISENVKNMNKLIFKNNKMIKKMKNEIERIQMNNKNLMLPITTPLASPVKLLHTTPNRKINNIIMKNL